MKVNNTYVRCLYCDTSISSDQVNIKPTPKDEIGSHDRVYFECPVCGLFGMSFVFPGTRNGKEKIDPVNWGIPNKEGNDVEVRCISFDYPSEMDEEGYPKYAIANIRAKLNVHDIGDLISRDSITLNNITVKKKENVIEKKTSEEWQKHCTVIVIDPDGWDRENYKYSWYEEKITKEEFEKRIMTSTVQRTQPILDENDNMISIWEEDKWK